MRHKYYTTLLLLGICILTPMIFWRVRANPPIREFNNIFKSDLDQRTYRGLELSNRMKVLLVSDPTTDKSAAAMDVRVGSMSDPVDIPGLAHFCEHMLFMGTEKYPEENDFEKFVSEHGGEYNGGTASDHTTYFFDIMPEKLDDGLDKFAQFFISPLFTVSATERELDSLNSEHESDIPIDFWRVYQLEKYLCDPDHDYHKFATGNRETIQVIPKTKGISVRDELLKFHDKWYSSNIMTLAVLGRESLDDLEKMVVELFSEIKDKNAKAPVWNVHPFSADKLKTVLKIVPVKDTRELNIIFPTPDLYQDYKSSPDTYLSYVIGFEGPGSLLSILKANLWANRLDAYHNYAAARGFGFFLISVDLTEGGMNHINDIVKLIFQYINMLKNTKSLDRVQYERQAIYRIMFKYKDKESPIDYVKDISDRLHKYPFEDVLSANHLFTEWKPELVTNLLNDFVPDKTRIQVIAKTVAKECNKVEPIFGTSFHLSQVPEETLEDWKNAGFSDKLRLPDENDFIPTNFHAYDLDEDITGYPSIIQYNPLTRVWFKQDDTFLLPKANLKFDFVSPIVCADPLHYNFINMFVDLFRDSFGEYAYAATLAGITWDLTTTKCGLTLSIGGFNDKQHIFLEELMDKFVNFKINRKSFQVVKNDYIRTLENFHLQQPLNRANYYINVLLGEDYWTNEQLRDATSDLTIERLENFIPQIFSKLHIEALLYGNLNRSTACELFNTVEKHLTSKFSTTPLLPEELPLNRQLQLEDGCNYMYQAPIYVHKSFGIELYYQCGLQSTEMNMKLELVAQLIDEPCFDILRNLEQLGYSTSCTIIRSHGAQGLRIFIHADKYIPAYLDERVENFLRIMKTRIEELSDTEFQRHKEALTARLLEKPKQIHSQFDDYWSEISTKQYNFDRNNIEVEYLKRLTKIDVLEFYEKMFSYAAPQRHKIAINFVWMGEDDGAGVTNQIDKNITLIRDLSAFKESHGMYPPAQPYIPISPENKKCNP